MGRSRTTCIALVIYGIMILAFLCLPLISVSFASVSKARYLSVPIRRYTTGWFTGALSSREVHILGLTSLKIALIVMVLSMIIAFFGALAFARY